MNAVAPHSRALLSDRFGTISQLMVTTGLSYWWYQALWVALDTWYARAYGLALDKLRYILDPANVHGPDSPSETFRMLK